MTVRTGDFPRSLFYHVLDPHFFKFGIVGTAAQHGRNRLGKRFRKKQIELPDKTLQRFAAQLSLFNHSDDRMIFGVLSAHHFLDFLDEFGKWFALSTPK